MTEITPNTAPKGMICGTCRFASTHTVAERKERFMIVCRRLPPQRLGRETAFNETLNKRHADTAWPVTIWDNWCGEWLPRRKSEEGTTA